MAKNGVDGIYDEDPKTNPNAKILENISSLDKALYNCLFIIKPNPISAIAMYANI